MRGYLKALLQRRVPAPIRKWAQFLADRLPPSVRYGKPYGDALALLRESETWDEKALVAYQEKRLQILINHCYANIPYYREVFQQNGLTPKDIQTVNDLQKLPFLTKEIVRKRKKDLIATNISFLNREEVSTSGSTGAPLDFYMDSTTRPMERALAFRHLSWLGYKNGDRLAVFKVPPLSDPKQFYQYLRRSNELRISFRDTDEPRLEKMVDLLEQFKPAFISAWPSSLYILARWMERNKRTIHPPKFIVTGSENMYPHMTERIEGVFKAPVSDFYGQEESVAIAMQCATGGGYHIQMEMGIVELVPFKDGMSEIVGTGLHNMVMPFLRYRTGDLATDSSGACPCGRKHPLISDIVGREADLIVTPEGKLVSPLLLNPPFNRLEEIKEGQIIQEDVKTLKIIIVPWESISESTKEQLGREISDTLASPGMRVIIEEVEGIPRSGSCKKAFVVSRIRLEDYSRGRIGVQRVLVVGPVPPPYGGIASVMEDIANSDLTKEYSSEIFDRSAVFPPGAEGFIGKNLFRARRFLRFFKKVRSGKYHFVHIHSSDPVFLGTTIFMLLSRLAGVKILLHVHGTDWTSFYSEAPLFKKFYTRIGLELPTKIVVLYQLWVDKVRELRPNADVRILRNFVHEQDPPSAREIEEARQSLGLTKEHCVVLTVGSVGKNKGSFEIMKAVPKTISRDDSIRFVLLGGEERPGNMAQLTSIVKEEKLGPWVHLTGELEREKVPAFLGFADIFLLPSFWEGMPVTIIEAMRSGLPIISTPVAGIPDMIDNGVSGLLINPGAPDEIADAVLLLKRDKELRDKLAAGARVRFEEKFEFSKGIQEIRVLYASM